MGRLRPLAVAAVACALIAGLAAHVRLQDPVSGNKLFWPSPSNVGIVINSAGSADIPDQSHETAIRLAIRAWNDATGTTAQLVEDTSPAQQARTDFTSTSIHLVLFDETNSSGLFADPNTVALTPVWYFGSGRISDADVLFNGQDQQFTTVVPGPAGHFDVEDIATHELGHLLGLDHSGWVGATMYPYVDPTVVLHRSLALDDVHGLRDAYPQGSFARLSGRVLRSAGSTPVEGAHVVARTTAGRTAGAALTAANGTFLIRGLEPGTAYEVLATPLDGAVTAANLGMGHVVETDFESTLAAGTFSPNAGQTVAVGDILVGADVALSLGTPGDPFPLRCEAGLTNFFVNSVHGAGLVPGSTLSTSDPALALGNVVWFGGARVDFSVAAPAGAAPGHTDLMVVDPSGDVSILPAALEISPQDPSLTTVVPNVGPDFGGTAVTITGDLFNPGARVVIGPNIYVDGELGGCTVVDASTITLATAAMPPGTYDVVVIDGTGVEGRRFGGFTANADLPDFDTVFPVAGDAAGGTLLTLRGQNFQSGLTVRINGVTQAGLTYHDATHLSVVTSAGVPGGPYDIDVVNPGGELATRAFTYVAAPDPAIAAVDPASGTTSGGTTVQIQGASFTAATGVVFGADADTGLGGTPAASVTFVDASTLDVVTPSMTAGAKSVLVQNPTGQAQIAAAAYTFRGSGGGGGGGCSVDPVRGVDPWQPLASGGWFLLAVLLAWWNARRLRRRALPV